MKFLSKSAYIAGLKCARHMWAKVNDTSLIEQTSAARERRMQQGETLNEYAQSLFPEGLTIDGPLKLDSPELQLRRPLFEAGFSFDRCYARADILIPVNGNEWDLVEVKSSTNVRSDEGNRLIHKHLREDLAFQKFCYEGAGLKIRNCYLMHPDKNYVRQGEIDVEKFLTMTHVSGLEQILEEMPQRIQRMIEIIDMKEFPPNREDMICHNGKYCDVASLCWENMPKESILDLYKGRQKIELYEKGIFKLSDIPIDFNQEEANKRSEKHRQYIQVMTHKAGEVHIEKENIRQFLDSIKYPLTLMDFETISSVIPFYTQSCANQQIPYQFSLHGMKSIDSEPYKIGEFLAEGKNDPRQNLMESLKKLIPQEGSIIVYNQAFEQKVLEQYAQQFPAEEAWVTSIISRLIDLMDVFKGFYYYNPKQKGRISIKKVLPALVGKGYENLVIGDGETTFLEFLRVEHGTVDEDDKKKSRENQLKYCDLDTLSMGWIIRELHNLSTPNI